MVLGWRHQPGQKGDLWSRFVPPTGTIGPYPPLARLAVGPGTKAPFDPEPNGRRAGPNVKTMLAHIDIHQPSRGDRKHQL